MSENAISVSHLRGLLLFPRLSDGLSICALKRERKGRLGIGFEKGKAETHKKSFYSTVYFLQYSRVLARQWCTVHIRIPVFHIAYMIS